MHLINTRQAGADMHEAVHKTGEMCSRFTIQHSCRVSENKPIYLDGLSMLVARSCPGCISRADSVQTEDPDRPTAAAALVWIKHQCGSCSQSVCQLSAPPAAAHVFASPMQHFNQNSRSLNQKIIIKIHKSTNVQNLGNPLQLL